MRKRDVHVQLWLNQKEAEALTRNTERCRLTRSAYLRHLIMGYVPREAPPPDYHAMMQQIYHVGRSLNQIAAKAHVLNVVDTQRYDESVRMLENAILKIEDAAIVPQESMNIASTVFSIPLAHSLSRPVRGGPFRKPFSI